MTPLYFSTFSNYMVLNVYTTLTSSTALLYVYMYARLNV